MRAAITTRTGGASPTQLCFAALVVLFLPALVFGQSGAPARPGEAAEPLWSARTRLQISGTSDSSDPAGYFVYSGVPIELSLRRDVGRLFSVEVSAALDSREVDTVRPDVAPRLNLGSIQVLPIDVAVLARPWAGRRVRPYAGAGLNLSIFWEKSGALDSMDLTPGVGLALRLGADFALSPATVLNVDVKWNRLVTDLEANGARVARLSISPLTLGVGWGFRF